MFAIDDDYKKQVRMRNIVYRRQSWAIIFVIQNGRGGRASHLYSNLLYSTIITEVLCSNNEEGQASGPAEQCGTKINREKLVKSMISDNIDKTQLIR